MKSTIGWIIMNFGKDVHVLLKMNCNNFQVKMSNCNNLSKNLVYDRIPTKVMTFQPA